MAQDRWIFEPGPEATDAAKQGAADVEKAQRLAKAKQYAEAAAVLEELSRKLPAAVHDCNLALAYLRAGALTRAQLVWDLSGLRNGVRPKWCTGEVSTQLSQALQAAKFVPTTIEVVPLDAVIEVGGIAMRSIRTVWLPPGPSVIAASAPGRAGKTVTATIAAPATKISITLEVPPPPETRDAGVPLPSTPDASVGTSIGSATQIQPYVPPEQGSGSGSDAVQDQPRPLLTIGGTPIGYRTVALSVALVGWAVTGIFGVLTYTAKQDANEHYPTDPMFEDKRDVYTSYAGITLGTTVVSAIATGVYIYFVARGDKVISRPGKVKFGLDASGDGIGVTFGGSFGGAK